MVNYYYVCLANAFLGFSNINSTLLFVVFCTTPCLRIATTLRLFFFKIGTGGVETI